MAIFGRRYQLPEDPGEHIRYMEEQLEFFARQMEKRLGELEGKTSATMDEERTGLQGLMERLEALEERVTALEAAGASPRPTE